MFSATGNSRRVTSFGAAQELSLRLALSDAVAAFLVIPYSFIPPPPGPSEIKSGASCLREPSVSATTSYSDEPANLAVVPDSDDAGSGP